MSKDSGTTLKKQGMIRYSGIFSFAVVTLVLAACFYFFAPWLVKASIESAGTKLAGAQVDIGSVDLSLFPGGIVLNGVEVTDAQNPMQNVFEVSRANASIDLIKLWMGQVIIDDLSVDALQFGTPRTRSGALAKDVGSNADKQVEQEERFLAEELDQLSTVLPDTKDLLSRQPLITEQLKTELDETYTKRKAEWKSISSKLPDEQKFEYYKREFKALTEGDISSLQDFTQRKQKFDALKAELEQDKSIVLLAKAQLDDSQSVIKKGIKDLRAAPQKDWEAIKSKYSFDESGALNITGLLFGNQFAHYAERALYWYRKLAPLMQSEEDNLKGNMEGSVAVEKKGLGPQRGSGRFIRFLEANPSPDFLIRKATASAVLSHGSLEVVAKDLTHQQYITNKPSVLTASGAALKNPQTLDFSLNIDHRTAAPKDEIKLSIGKQALANTTLSDSKNMPLRMEQASMDLNSTLILKGEALEGDVKANFTQAKLVGEGETTLAKEVVAMLSEVNSFSLSADLGGELGSPDIGLSSDLDAMLKNAFASRLKKKQAEWEAKLKAGLDEKLKEYFAQNEELAKYFSGQESLVDTDLSQIDELLSKQLASYADQHKEKAKSKAESKLKDALKGLF